MKLFVGFLISLLGLFSLTAFDPITILALIGTALMASAVIIYILLLTIETVRDWFANNKPLKKNAVAFAYREARENNKIKVITGFFDTKEDDVIKHQTYEAEELEKPLKKMLPKGEIAILT